ncbi:DUF4349 domain-containing protein [Parerythrobacter aestuarii]|uniref:DUF4349 domain-containing protein n=1 Tax=Parerythrobacter aestuarii TaxID=3020909 RepID=UPI0024DEF936|nr:DUF4349 domain-containing protein [Parerythrobacter aestuarii]
MREYQLAIAILAIGLSGCGEAEQGNQAQAIVERLEPVSYADSAPRHEFGFMEAMETGPDLFGSSAPSARNSVARVATLDIEEPRVDPSPQAQAASPPQQIAYSYGFGFQIAGDKIGELQQAHAKLCEAMGDKCRILRMSQATADNWDGYGELKMQVASDDAAVFGSGLTAPAEKLGGELISSVRDGEDLSEQIIDSEARLASRLVLRDKLTAILRSNRGSVDELVKAEKAVAEVNEEIDATRSKLEQFRNRIRYSAVNIEYEPYFGETQLGFSRPVMTAFRSIGTTLGTTIAALIYLITAAIPVILLILGLRWILHRFGLRIRFWKKDPPLKSVG